MQLLTLSSAYSPSSMDKLALGRVCEVHRKKAALSGDEAEYKENIGQSLNRALKLNAIMLNPERQSLISFPKHP